MKKKPVSCCFAFLKRLAHQMKYFTILIAFFFLQSCEVSSISDKKASDLRNLEARILITTMGSGENATDYFSLYLSDGKKQIINDNIKILLNDVPMILIVTHKPFYQKSSVYTTDELTQSATYYVEIILPDGTKHPLAFIKPFKRNADATFQIPKSVLISEDLTFTWKELNFSPNVEIWKSSGSLKTPTGNNRFSAATVHHTIATASGSYTLPKSFYKDSLSLADYVHIRVSDVADGLMNDKLLQDSEITHTYEIEKTVPLLKESTDSAN